jgi:hypothetical protein
MFLPCKYIIALSLCSKHLNKCIKDNNIVNKRKNLGFPRISGHCFSYDASSYKYFKSSEDLIYYGLDNKSSSILLDLFIKSNIDLVRGDLIHNNLYERYNKGICIFDGCKIVNLDDSDKDQIGSLPSEFNPIHNGVNIDYWSTICEKRNFGLSNLPTLKIVLRRGFYDRNAWLDISSIKFQLVDNIKLENKVFLGKYNVMDNNIMVYSTKFMFNDVEYYILLPYFLLWYDNSVDIFELFKEIITSQSKLIIDYDSPDNLFNENIDYNDNILFLHQSYLDEYSIA